MLTLKYKKIKFNNNSNNNKNTLLNTTQTKETLHISEVFILNVGINVYQGDV